MVVYYRTVAQFFGKRVFCASGATSDDVGTDASFDPGRSHPLAALSFFSTLVFFRSIILPIRR